MTYDTRSPTAIALATDEEFLYVAESGLGEDGRECEAIRFTKTAAWELIAYHTFGSDHRGPHRGISGMCVDRDGSIIACAGWEKSGPGAMIYLFAPSGRVVETQLMSERPTNCALGDSAPRTIYVTTEKGHLYRVRR